MKFLLGGYSSSVWTQSFQQTILFGQNFQEDLFFYDDDDIFNDIYRINDIIIYDVKGHMRRKAHMYDFHNL